MVQDTQSILLYGLGYPEYSPLWSRVPRVFSSMVQGTQSILLYGPGYPEYCQPLPGGLVGKVTLQNFAKPTRVQNIELGARVQNTWILEYIELRVRNTHFKSSEFRFRSLEHKIRSRSSEYIFKSSEYRMHNQNILQK